MKTCGKCGKEKDKADFYKRSKSSDELQSWCILCIKKNRKKHYKNNRVGAARSVAKRKLRLKKRVWNYLKEHPCVDCGEGDPVVLEFDHVRGEKDRDISRLVSCGLSWKNILIEIEKCEVRCANCHRGKTASRNGWYDHMPL